MSVTLSPPIRVAALVGALALTALAALVLLVGPRLAQGEPESVTGTAPVVQSGQKPAVTPAATPKPAAPRAPARIASGFPPKIDHALRYSRVVVVSVSVPGSAVDAIVRREAQTAATASRARFVRLSATNERAVSGLVAKTGLLPSPAVVVVRRPGVVVATFSVTDAATISQAVAQAQR